MLTSRLTLLLVLCLAASYSLHAQSGAPAVPSVPAAIKLDYPDSASGLERLAKDIMEAQRKDDSARADLLLKSMALPNAAEWYERVFKNARVGGYYDRASASVPSYLAKLFLNAQSHDFIRPQARRFEDSCDDNAPEITYDMLLKRQEPIPIYELRFLNGDKFTRIFPIVYVDGGFRFLLDLDYQPPKPAEEKADTKPEEPAEKPQVPRLRVGGAVQAAKLISRVQPAYPEVARQEHLQGNVTLRVVIGKDGSIVRIWRVHGACSLAKSSVEAVRQWRYQPTMLNGNPVEIDTEIQVFFKLSP